MHSKLSTTVNEYAPGKRESRKLSLSWLPSKMPQLYSYGPVPPVASISTKPDSLPAQLTFTKESIRTFKGLGSRISIFSSTAEQDFTSLTVTL